MFKDTLHVVNLPISPRPIFAANWIYILQATFATDTAPWPGSGHGHQGESLYNKKMFLY